LYTNPIVGEELEMKMTKQQFKDKWESDENGGGITFNDIADCAVAWGLYSHPKTSPINEVVYNVLSFAQTGDAEEYKN
jgi:hypothetical protein